MKRKTLVIFGVLVILALAVIIPFAPIIPVNSSSFNLGNFSSSSATYGSISYVLFKCGEVHATFSLGSNGNNYGNSDQYRWVCGQG